MSHAFMSKSLATSRNESNICVWISPTCVCVYCPSPRMALMCSLSFLHALSLPNKTFPLLLFIPFTRPPPQPFSSIYLSLLIGRARSRSLSLFPSLILSPFLPLSLSLPVFPSLPFPRSLPVVSSLPVVPCLPMSFPRSKIKTWHTLRDFRLQVL